MAMHRPAYDTHKRVAPSKLRKKNTGTTKVQTLAVRGRMSHTLHQQLSAVNISSDTTCSVLVFQDKREYDRKHLKTKPGQTGRGPRG